MKINFKFWKSDKAEESGLSTYSFNKATNWENNPNYNLSSPTTQNSSRGWVEFGLGDNYPDVLLDMYHGSPFHAAIINFKIKAVMAGGITIVAPELDELEATLTLNRLKAKMDRNFLRKFIADYLIHERVYVKVTVRNGKVTGFDIIPAQKVRVNESGNIFYVSDSWGRSTRSPKSYPKYDKYNTVDNEQIIEFINSKPGFDYYTVPEYASANNWIWLDSEIAFFQKQNIEQSINPSAIIKFYQDIANTEEKNQFIQSLSDSFSSAKNAGKVMVFFANGKDLAPDIDIAEPNKLDKSFADTQENIIRNVAYAHMVNPVLMGVATQGKLGSTNEINEAFALFSSVWLANAQDNIEEYLNILAKTMLKTSNVTIIRQQTLV